MRKMNLFFKKHSSTILTCAGAVGLVATSVVTAKAAVKAHDILEKAKEEKGSDLTTSETIMATAKVYIPPVLIGASSIACIFGATVLNKRQQASMASAYALVATSYSEYKNKLKEMYGEETHQSIVDAIAAEKAKDVHISSELLSTNCSLELEDGESEPRLFYDEYSNRYFEATVEQVMAAEYHLNRNYVLRGYTVLNELYDFLGLEPTEYGSTVGWSVFNGDDIQWIDFNHHKTIINDDLECYVIEMPYCPRRGLFGRLKSAKNTRRIMKQYKKGV